MVFKFQLVKQNMDFGWILQIKVTILGETNSVIVAGAGFVDKPEWS